jgi:hypothetical protein
MGERYSQGQFPVDFLEEPARAQLGSVLCAQARIALQATPIGALRPLGSDLGSGLQRDGERGSDEQCAD